VATLVERIELILEEGKFSSARAWCLAAGLSISYLGTLKSRLESGEVRQGKSEQIAKLARAAGVTVEWLMGESDQREPTRTSMPAPATSAFEAAQLAYQWPSMTIEQANEVFQRLEADRAKASPLLPQVFWMAHFDRIVAEIVGATPPSPKTRSKSSVFRKKAG
jgi:hypothetical protein